MRRAFAIALLAGWAAGAMPGPLRPGVTLAASCVGASHSLALADGTASPDSGAPGTVFVFSVRYIDNAGCPATSAVVTIPGVGSFPLAPLGAAPAGGLHYGAGVALPPGTWTYQFSASSGSGAGAEAVTLTAVTPAVIQVIAPATAPPTARPTPKPTPAPTARPTPPPTPAATATSSPTPVATASPSRSEDPATGAGGSTTGGASGPSVPPDAVPVQRDEGVTARRPVNAAIDGDGSLDRRPADAGVDLGSSSPASLGLPAGVPLPALAWSLSTLGGLLIFAVFLRTRERQGSAIRVAGIGTPLGGVAPLPSGSQAQGVIEPGDGYRSQPDESMLGGARHHGPIGRSAVRPPLRFDRPPAPGVERRIVSYQGVRVGDGPDGVRSVEQGRLERGDEVEVLEWRAGAALVRAPGGVEGWIHGAAIIGGFAADDV